MDTQGSEGYEFLLYQNNRLSLAVGLLQVLEKLEHYLILTSEYPSSENEIERFEDGLYTTLVPNQDFHGCYGFTGLISNYEEITGLTHLDAAKILGMESQIFGCIVAKFPTTIKSVSDDRETCKSLLTYCKYVLEGTTLSFDSWDVVNGQLQTLLGLTEHSYRDLPKYKGGFSKPTYLGEQGAKTGTQT